MMRAMEALACARKLCLRLRLREFSNSTMLTAKVFTHSSLAILLWIHITGFASWRRPSVQLRDVNFCGAARLWFVRGGSRDHAVAVSGCQRSHH